VTTLDPASSGAILAAYGAVMINKK
jgi:hypothetical protein